MSPQPDLWSTWGPPIVVLLLGLIVGLVIALLSRGRAAPGSLERADQVEALRARRDSLLEQLRLLEADRQTLPEAVRLERREALISAAAAVLAELEALEQAPAAAEPLATPAAAPAPSGKQALWRGVQVAGLLVFFAVVALSLTEAGKPRQMGAPPTGGGAAPEGLGQAEVLEAEQKLAANPQDIDALNVLTYSALLRRDFQAAMTHVEAARQVNPEHPDVLIHLGILRLSVNMHEAADSSLRAAIAAQPTRGRAHLWLGLSLLMQQQNDAAIGEFEQALSLGLRADEQGFAQQMIRDAKNPRPAAAAGAPSAGGAEAPAAPGYSGPGGGGATLGGQVRLSDALAAAVDQQPGRVVFVMVYRNAEGRPPPVATAKLSRDGLPWSFQFEQGHAMMGGGWPEQVWIKARLDADGQPGASAGDVDSALMGPFAVGATGVELVIGG
ncbi:MAG: hypothetical protein JNM72_28060 [Deltaproteobacteria bacterium]|nr:hypothetical protein [Deltaproteobacteria bacterium]